MIIRHKSRDRPIDNIRHIAKLIIFFQVYAIDYEFDIFCNEISFYKEILVE